MDKNCYNLWRQVLDECFSVRAFSVVKPQILPIVKKQPIGCFFVKNVLYPGTYHKGYEFMKLREKQIIWPVFLLHIMSDGLNNFSLKKF